MRRISTSSAQRRGQRASLQLRIRDFSHTSPSRATHTADYVAVTSEPQHYSQQLPCSRFVMVTPRASSSSSSSAAAAVAGAPDRGHGSSIRLDKKNNTDYNNDYCRNPSLLLSLPPLVPSYAARGYGPFTRTFGLLAPRSGTVGSLGVGASRGGNSGVNDTNTIEVGLSDDIEIDISAEERGKGKVGVDAKSGDTAALDTTRAKGVAGGAASGNSLFGDTRPADEEEVVVFDGDDDEEVGSSTSTAGGGVDRTTASLDKTKGRGVGGDSAPTAVAFQRLAELVDMADLEEEDEVGGSGTDGNDRYENNERKQQASPSSFAPPSPPPEQRRPQHVLTKPKYISPTTTTASTGRDAGGGSPRVSSPTQQQNQQRVGRNTAAATKSEHDKKDDVGEVVDVVVDIDGGGVVGKEEEDVDSNNNKGGEGYNTNGLSKKAFANLEEMAQFESIDDGVSLGSVEFETAVADTTNNISSNTDNKKSVTSGSDAVSSSSSSDNESLLRFAARTGAKGLNNDTNEQEGDVTKMTNLEELVKRAEEEALRDDNDAFSSHSSGSAFLNTNRKSNNNHNAAVGVGVNSGAKNGRHDDDSSDLIDDLFDDVLSILPAAAATAAAATTTTAGARAATTSSFSSSLPQSSVSSNARAIISGPSSFSSSSSRKEQGQQEQFTHRPKPTLSPFAATTTIPLTTKKSSSSRGSGGYGAENSAFAPENAKEKSSRFSSSSSSSSSSAPLSMEGGDHSLDFDSSVEIGVGGALAAADGYANKNNASSFKTSDVLGVSSTMSGIGTDGLGLAVSSSSATTAAVVAAPVRLSDPNTDRSFFEQTFPVRPRPLCRGYVVAWYPDRQYGYIVDAEDLNAQEDFILQTKALSNLITAAATSGGTSTASDPLATLFKVYRVGSKSIRFTNFSKLPERFHTLHVFRQVEFDKGVHPDAPTGSTDYTIAKNVCDVGGYTLPPGPERDLRILEEIVVETAEVTTDGREGERGDADAAASSTLDGAQQNTAAKKKRLVSVSGSTSGARQAPTFSGESETTPNAKFRSDFFSNAPVPGTSGNVGDLGSGIGGTEDEASVRLVRRSERNHNGRGGRPLDVFGPQQGGGNSVTTSKSRFFSTEIQGMFSAVSPGAGMKSVRTTVLSNNSALNSPFSSYVPDRAAGDDDGDDDGGVVDFSYSASDGSVGRTSSSSTMIAAQNTEPSPYSVAVASNSVKNSRTMMATGVLRKEVARGGGAGGKGSSSSSSSSEGFSISAAAKRGGRGRGRGGGRGRGAGITRGPLPDSPATSRFQKKI